MDADQQAFVLYPEIIGDVRGLPPVCEALCIKGVIKEKVLRGRGNLFGVEHVSNRLRGGKKFLFRFMFGVWTR